MKTRFKREFALILILIMIFSMTSCDVKNDTDSSKRDDLIIGILTEPETLDPIGYNGGLTGNMFDSLVDIDEEGNIIPCIAESWDISDDGLSYTFKIKSDLKFQNGDPLTVNDVKFSLDRAKASPLTSDVMDPYESCEIVDDNKVTIKLAYQYSIMLISLADTSASIVNEKIVTERGEDFGIDISGAGTGPYEFVSWEKGVSLSLKANPNSYLGEPEIKEIEYRFFKERSTGVISVEAGEIDVFTKPSMIDVENLKNNKDIAITSKTQLGLGFLGFNVTMEPFDDVRVRQAIAYAFDKKENVEASIGADGEVAQAYISPSFRIGYSDEFTAYPKDLEKAKDLLAQAGYPDGLEITLYGRAPKELEYLQASLKEVGIDASIQVLEMSKFVSDLIDGNLGAFVMTNVISIPDADKFLYTEFVTDQSFNVHKYSNTEVDQILFNARVELDEEKREELYAEAQTILMDEVPLVPLYFPVAFVAYNNKLNGYSINALGVRLEKLSWQ